MQNLLQPLEEKLRRLALELASENAEDSKDYKQILKIVEKTGEIAYNHHGEVVLTVP